jgi:uncharacterized membrane protein
VRVTRLNVAGEIAVAIAVVAVLVYELIYSGTAARAAALVALLAGVALCRLTISRLRQHPGELGRVQLAIALLFGGTFVLADRFPRTAFLLLCAFVAGFLASALAGLRRQQPLAE